MPPFQTGPRHTSKWRCGPVALPVMPDPPDLLAAPDMLAAPDRDRRHVVVRRVQVRTVGDPDLVAAAVVLPAGEDHRPGRRRLDPRAPVGGDVERVVAVVEVLADVAAVDGPGELAAAVLGRRLRARVRRRCCCSPLDDFATGFGAAGLGVAMPAPWPPGIVSVWPRTRFGIVELVGVDDLLRRRPGTSPRAPRACRSSSTVIDDAADRRDRERLADVEIVLRP